MIKYYYKSLRIPAMQELASYKRGAWVYVEAPSDEEIQQLITDFSVDVSFIEDALDEDEMPRLEKEDGISYIFVRFAYRDSEGELKTAPLLFIFGKEVLLTISPVHLPSLDAFINGRVEFATTQRAKLLLQILQLIGEQYDTFIGRIDRRIKQVRVRLRQQEIRSEDFIDFVTIQDELNEFLSALRPTNATLRRLLLSKYIPLYEEDQDIVEDIMLNNEQSMEACISTVKSIDGMREAHSAISSHNLNRTMKILTIATLGITIPNMCFGLYSMNVPLPLQHQAFMYWVIIGFTIVLTAFVFIFGRRKRIF